MTDLKIVEFYYYGKKEFYECVVKLPSGKEVKVDITLYYTSENELDDWEWECDEALTEREAEAIDKCVQEKIAQMS